MSTNSDTFEKLQLVLARHRNRLLRYPNVTGVGIGYKKVKGLTTNTPAIIVFVKKKIPVSELAPSSIIPPIIEDFPTDVIEAEFSFLSQPPRTSRIRPSIGGISVGHFRITAGTIGDIMTDYVNKRKTVCSNNHVLAVCAPYGPAEKGDPIYQPGPYDGGTSDDTIANLERWVPLNPKNNIVDAAIATPVNDEIVSPNHYDFGVVSGPTPKLYIGMEVQKSGRTTGLTTGKISVVSVSAIVRSDYGDFPFSDVVAVETSAPFALGGDSGSLVVEKATAKPIGLVFAGNRPGTFTVICKLAIISSMLNVGYLPMVTGKVVDRNGKPIKYAVASIPEIGVERTLTDDDGSFVIGNLAYGSKFTLTVFHPQYEVEYVDFVADQDYVDLGEIKLKELPPPTPSLSQMLSDLAVYVGFLSLFAYWFTPEIMKTVKGALEEI